MRGILRAGAILGGVGVAAGAFGAHGLEAHFARRLIEAPDLDLAAIYETAARYHMIHALALIAVALTAGRHPGRAARAAGWAFLIGIGLFCGSLYGLALSGVRWLGMITPLGGLALLAGWGLFAMACRAPEPE